MTGIARFAPGSEQWIAALQPTDDDAIRLDRFDVNTMTAEAAARLWARVAAWVESDQIAYYIDDCTGQLRRRLRRAHALPANGSKRRSPHWTIRSRPPIASAAPSPTTSPPCATPARMMSLDDVFSIEELQGLVRLGAARPRLA